MLAAIDSPRIVLAIGICALQNFPLQRTNRSKESCGLLITPRCHCVGYDTELSTAGPLNPLTFAQSRYPMATLCDSSATGGDILQFDALTATFVSRG
jgi:hypothetical protein